MHEVRIDPIKNRLYLKFAGLLTADELRQAVDAGLGALDELSSGFDVITDISDFKVASPDGAQEIERAQRLLKARGMRQIIRVVGAEALGKMQFKRTSNETGIPWKTAASVADAERMLDR